MRFIKLAVISILSIFILFTVIGLLIPSSVTVVRSQNMLASIDTIRSYTNDLSKWKDWINGADTSSFKQLTATSTAINSKILLGAYTIVIEKNSANSFQTAWQTDNVTNEISTIELYHDNTSDSTTVNWRFQQHLKWYPWERLSGMLHDKILGPSMESSLQKLKTIVEKN